jgi:predicted enzyme related to lactoylglutathione lyase
MRGGRLKVRRHFDHIDQRVRDMGVARPFYDSLLPALGFIHDAKIAGWVQYEAAGETEAPVFFGLTESTRHVANECRIAFWADSHADVRRLAAIAVTAGAQHIEGPLYEEPGYYAVFFEDPSGNRLEICYRESPHQGALSS